jgi:hypothetical protein
VVYQYTRDREGGRVRTVADVADLLAEAGDPEIISPTATLAGLLERVPS